MVNQICQSGLHLNKVNLSDTGASFLDLHLIISDGFLFLSKFIINVNAMLILILLIFLS